MSADVDSRLSRLASSPASGTWPPDVDAWEELLQQSPSAVLPRAAAAFPHCGWLWVRLAEAEGGAGADEEVLRRALAGGAGVDVWGAYLGLLQRKCKELGGDELVRARAEVVKAFEEAVEPGNVGHAVDAAPVWRAYLDFVNSEPEQSSFDQGQKISAMRKVYQRVLLVPLRGLETIWREYQAFENGKSPVTAKKILDEWAPKYKNTHEILKERDAVWKFVLPLSTKLPRPFQANAPSAGAALQQYESWVKVLNYEKNNSEHLSLVDLKMRVRYAYKRALAELRFYPDIWYGFAEFERSKNDMEACLTILREAVRALPASTLLRFSLCDALELADLIAEAKDTYETLLREQPTAAAYVQYMVFAQRHDGVLASRAVFRAARASPVCDASVYCAAAELEFRANKAPAVARAVFELALKRYPRDGMVAHQYLDLLSHLNEDSAQRDLFERLLETFTAAAGGAASSQDGELVYAIWERYLTFAQAHCRDGRDVATLTSLEKRFAEAFDARSELTGLTGVLHRYSACPSVATGPDVGFLDRVGRQHHAAQAGQGGRATATAAALGSGARSSNGGGDRFVLRVNPTTTAASGSSSGAEPGSDLSSVPPYLHKLLSLLPTRISGIMNVDVDYIVRALSKGTLPPPPPRPVVSVTSATSAMASDGGLKKRKLDVLGVDGAPLDAFKLRQMRSGGGA